VACDLCFLPAPNRSRPKQADPGRKKLIQPEKKIDPGRDKLTWFEEKLETTTKLIFPGKGVLG